MAINIVDPSKWTASLSQTANQLSLGGQLYWVQDAARNWSLTSPSPDVLRFEVRPGDVWTYADGASKERSEISGTTNYATGTEIDVHYGFQIEPGAANNAAWTVVGQFHQDAATGGSPPFAVSLDGEQMAIRVGFSDAAGAPVQETVYLDPTPIQRGRVYDIRVAVTFDPKGNGALVVWRDGVEIVDYRGALGYTGQTSTYFKEGIYRSASSTTLAADYSGLTTVAARGLTQTGAPIPSQLTLTQVLTADTGVSATDLVSNQGGVHLFGVATSTRTVTVRDGGAVLATVAADTTGHWSWWGTLGDGTHSLTASALSASGVTSTTAAAPTLVIDHTPPAAPVVTGVTNDTGRSASDLVTSAHRMGVTGLAEAGAVVKVYLNGTALGVTTADAAGRWTYDGSAVAIADGRYNLTATAMDAAGDVSLGSAGVLLTVDDTAPVTTVSNLPFGGAGATLNGLSRAGAVVTVSADGVAPVTALVASNTVWSASLPGAGLSTVRTYTVSTTDLAGNAGATFHVVAGTAAADTLTAVTAGDVLVGGAERDVFVLSASAADGVGLQDFETGRDSVVFTGFDKGTGQVRRLDATHWRVSDADHAAVFTVRNGADLGGAWTFAASTPTPTPPDPTPTPPTPTPPTPTPPIAPPTTLTAPVISGIASDTGSSSGDGITRDAVIDVSGTGTPGSTVQLFDAGRRVATAVTGADGRWTAHDPVVHTDGKYVLYANAYDSTGAVSAVGASYVAQVDTATYDAAVRGATLRSGALTVQGVAESLSAVSLTAESGVVVAGAATGWGTWSLTVAPSTSSVSTFLLASADLAGNAGATTHLVVGTADGDVLTAVSAGDALLGGAGADVFVLPAGAVDRSVILDLAAQDSVIFRGFDTATSGVERVDSTHWRVFDAGHSEVLTVLAGAVLHDWSFT